MIPRQNKLTAPKPTKSKYLTLKKNPTHHTEEK